MWAITISPYCTEARDGLRRVLVRGQEALCANFAKGAPRGDNHVPLREALVLDDIACEVLWKMARMDEPWKKRRR